jgi:HTH-like domain
MAAHGFSQRRACRLLAVDPKTVRRAPMADAPEIRQRLRDLAGERRRFGDRRLGILLAREGITMNHKKLYRLYREEGLAVRRRRGRKRATGTRAPMTIPQRPNQRWSLDFVADVLSWGRRLRVPAIVDDFTRAALALVVDSSIGGRTGMDQPDRHPVALQRAWQANPERPGRELHRQVPRRVPERGGVRRPGRGPRPDRTMAPRLRPGAPALGPSRPDT